jgi:hypothetical protein
MDSKGESEEISYPHIYFAIDDFEQVLINIIICKFCYISGV